MLHCAKGYNHIAVIISERHDCILFVWDLYNRIDNCSFFMKADISFAVKIKAAFLLI